METQLDDAIGKLEDIIDEFDGKEQVYLSMDRICELWELLTDYRKEMEW